MDDQLMGPTGDVQMLDIRRRVLGTERFAICGGERAAPAFGILGPCL